jgi:serine/threonine protein kinase
MSFLPDHVLDHLRAVSELPDFAGTRYQLGAEIGRGGMGTVYRARDTVLGRQVALKVLHAADREPGAGERILEEARIIARLEHPGIVPVHDAGVLGDGRVYYAMKLVEGLRLDEFARSTTVLAARLRVFQKVCEAVAFAHSRGVVHRDLKPENIMTGAFGEVLTMDWGVARSLLDRAEGPGTVVGTPRYIAPEQAAGVDADPRADIYSLGAILRFLLPAPAPRALAAIAGKAMSADPAARYATALELSADIEQYLENLPVSAYRENLFEKGARLFTRNQSLMMLLLAYVLVRVALLVWRNLR